EARDQNPRHNIDVNLDPELPAVRGDPDKLSQVLTILLDNAFKYSPPGTDIAVTSESTGDHIMVMVKDHGPGMPAGFASGLLESYPNPGDARNGTHSSNGGTGLGLPIARQIVEMHGGASGSRARPRADPTSISRCP
ncbi:MAG: sensor histidine kinase, partial [Chloroflexi bacterium]